VTERDHKPRLPGEAARVRESRERVAWRLDIGNDAYALLLWPMPGAAENVSGRLTPAEREVVRMIAAGLSNAEIARRRGSSPRTVANQASSIFRKLGVRSRLGLYALLASGAEGDEAKP